MILESANLEEEDEIDEVDSVKIFDESVVKLVEIRNALETLQKLCLYQEKSNACEIFYNSLHHCMSLM